MKANLIILAGGNSTRMCHPKGLLDISGEPWLLQQLALIREVKFELVVLILGHNWENYCNEIPQLLDCINKVQKFNEVKLKVSINSTPEKGSFSSLQKGISSSLDENSFPAYIKPIDVPMPDLEVWENLNTALSFENSVIIPSYRKRSGHPVLLSHEFMSSLVKLNPSNPQSRLDSQIQRLQSSKIVYVEVDDPNITLNLNTPNQWNNFLKSVN
jgi:CTP:molybdopterin cytidylyltransferase MocA